VGDPGSHRQDSAKEREEVAVQGEGERDLSIGRWQKKQTELGASLCFRPWRWKKTS
jgi:hypothetical protein